MVSSHPPCPSRSDLLAMPGVLAAESWRGILLCTDRRREVLASVGRWSGFAELNPNETHVGRLFVRGVGQAWEKWVAFLKDKPCRKEGRIATPSYHFIFLGCCFFSSLRLAGPRLHPHPPSLPLGGLVGCCDDPNISKWLFSPTSALKR